MKQVIEVEVDVPDGYRCVGVGRAKNGDVFMPDHEDGKVDVWFGYPSMGIYFLLEEDTPLPIGSMVEASDDGVNWVKGELLKVLDKDDWHFPYVVWIEEDERTDNFQMIRPVAEPKWQLASMEDIGSKVFVAGGAYPVAPQDTPDYFNDPDKLIWILTDICPRSGRYAVKTESGNRATYKTVYIRK